MTCPTHDAQLITPPDADDEHLGLRNVPGANQP